MKFESYPLRFRFFHSGMKQGNLNAYILSSIRHKAKKCANIMKLINAIICSHLR